VFADSEDGSGRIRQEGANQGTELVLLFLVPEGLWHSHFYLNI
jgi:hypothetical protein